MLYSYLKYTLDFGMKMPPRDGNNVALKKFDAVHLDVLRAIASRVREKGTATAEFSFEELLGRLFEDKREARERAE